MNMEDMILISVDDHVIEPPHAFRNHMPKSLSSRAPYVEHRPEGDRWVVDGRTVLMAGLNAVVGRPRSEYGIEPMSFGQVRAGSYDINARIDDMNANGVLGSMCFPTLLGFGGGLASSFEDKEYALSLVRAYNDWHVHEWVGGAPGRLIPLGLLPLWDMPGTVAEVKRLSALGVHAVCFPDNPTHDGLPSIHSEYWDPLWKACSDHQIVLCCHIGTSGAPPTTSPDEPAAAFLTTLPMATSFPAADWMFAPMWKKFPSLRMALSEAQIGWIPFLMERADFVYEHHGAWTNFSLDKGEKPSDVFKRHVIVCFIDDKFGLKNRHEIGVDNITWECDYPHSDCTWPDSPEILWEGLSDIPAEDIAKITHLNAMREFSFDPFTTRSRKDCTVGALRAAAAHINTRPVSGLGGAVPVSDGAVVTVGHMHAALVNQGFE